MKNIKKDLNKIDEIKFEICKFLKENDALVAHLNEIFLRYDNIVSKLITKTQRGKNEI